MKAKCSLTIKKSEVDRNNTEVKRFSSGEGTQRWDSHKSEWYLAKSAKKQIHPLVASIRAQRQPHSLVTP